MPTIDKIQVQGTTYDINLPATAKPSISSLTVTGNLTVSGTANLSVVTFTNSAATGVVGSITAVAAGIILSNTRFIGIMARQLSISALTLSLQQGSNTYSLPNKSGTVALTSDISGIKLYHYCFRSDKISSSSPIVLTGAFAIDFYSEINLNVNAGDTLTNTELDTKLAQIKFNGCFPAKGYGLAQNKPYLIFAVEFKDGELEKARGIYVDTYEDTYTFVINVNYNYTCLIADKIL